MVLWYKRRYRQKKMMEVYNNGIAKHFPLHCNCHIRHTQYEDWYFWADKRLYSKADIEIETRTI
jgi:hypothetical protein